LLLRQLRQLLLLQLLPWQLLNLLCSNPQLRQLLLQLL
jgi:hypothetical protein